MPFKETPKPKAKPKKNAISNVRDKVAKSPQVKSSRAQSKAVAKVWDTRNKAGDFGSGTGPDRRPGAETLGFPRWRPEVRPAHPAVQGPPAPPQNAARKNTGGTAQGRNKKKAM